MAAPNELLRQERMRLGWSAHQVAEKIGVATKTIEGWERGIIFPSPYNLRRLSELYGKSPQELGLLPRTTLQTEKEGKPL
jgi:transcriptional regulator with XRE-family HTH domain